MKQLVFGWTACPNCSCINPLTVSWRFIKTKRARCACCKKAFRFTKKDFREEKIGAAENFDPSSKIKSIKRIEVRQFYDSTWNIELKNGESCCIVRDDLATEEELRELVERYDSAEEIQKALDMRNKIYYD